MKRERHPRITPLRALDLLRKIESERPVPEWVRRELSEALSEHVKAALVRRKR